MQKLNKSQWQSYFTLSLHISLTWYERNLISINFHLYYKLHGFIHEQKTHKTKTYTYIISTDL